MSSKKNKSKKGGTTKNNNNNTNRTNLWNNSINTQNIIYPSEQVNNITKNIDKYLRLQAKTKKNITPSIRFPQIIPNYYPKPPQKLKPSLSSITRATRLTKSLSPSLIKAMQNKNQNISKHVNNTQKQVQEIIRMESSPRFQIKRPNSLSPSNKRPHRRVI
jgi:hypothetical protein